MKFHLERLHDFQKAKDPFVLDKNEFQFIRVRVLPEDFDISDSEILLELVHNEKLKPVFQNIPMASIPVSYVEDPINNVILIQRGSEPTTQSDKTMIKLLYPMKSIIS